MLGEEGKDPYHNRSKYTIKEVTKRNVKMTDHTLEFITPNQVGQELKNSLLNTNILNKGNNHIDI